MNILMKVDFSAMLTEIDAIKKYANVLILTTSNVTGTIDLAFVDRADLKKYIGLPSVDAIKLMLRGSIEELIDKHVLNGVLLSEKTFKYAKDIAKTDKAQFDNTYKLNSLAENCVGFSGRTIRKLPVLSLAKMIENGVKKSQNNFELEVYMDHLSKLIELEKLDVSKCFSS